MDSAVEGLSVDGLKKSLASYGAANPLKMFALVTFSVLGVIPVLAFAAYVVATLLALVIGSVVVELFLLAAGIICLAFVLFFVTCITLCVTSVFGALVMSYRLASSTLMKSSRFPFSLSQQRSVWPYSSSHSSSSEQREGEGETDKTKISAGHTFEQLTDSPIVPKHDFIHTALLTLTLVTSIVALCFCVFITAYIVVWFT